MRVFFAFGLRMLNCFSNWELVQISGVYEGHTIRYRLAALAQCVSQGRLQFLLAGLSRRGHAISTPIRTSHFLLYCKSAGLYKIRRPLNITLIGTFYFSKILKWIPKPSTRNPVLTSNQTTLALFKDRSSHIGSANFCQCIFAMSFRIRSWKRWQGTEKSGDYYTDKTKLLN